MTYLIICRLHVVRIRVNVLIYFRVNLVAQPERDVSRLARALQACAHGAVVVVVPLATYIPLLLPVRVAKLAAAAPPEEHVTPASW